MIPEFDASDVDHSSLITKMLGAACLKNTVVALSTSGTWKDGSATDKFMKFLFGIPNLEKVVRR